MKIYTLNLEGDSHELYCFTNLKLAYEYMRQEFDRILSEYQIDLDNNNLDFYGHDKSFKEVKDELNECGSFVLSCYLYDTHFSHFRVAITLHDNELEYENVIGGF